MIKKDYRIKIQNLGFSLAEIIISTLIIVAGLIPVFDMMSSAQNTVASVEDEVIAFSLATEASEWMRGLSYTDLNYPKFRINIFKDKFIEEKSSYIHLENPVETLKFDDEEIEYKPEKRFKRFSRKIEIFKKESDSGIKVRVTISWKNKGSGKKDAKMNMEFIQYKI